MRSVGSDFAKTDGPARQTRASARWRNDRSFILASSLAFGGEDADGVDGGVEHVIAFAVGAAFDGDADAFAFGAGNDGDDFFEFASWGEAFDAGGRAGFGGQDVAVGE